MTFEEFERLPEWCGKQELLLGELIELPPPKKRHNKVAKRLFVLLFDAIERAPEGSRNPALGEVNLEWGYHVTSKPDSWLIPDLSITHPNQPGDEYYEGAPLLAVEVVSPSNTANQIVKKVKTYLANGSKEVWVLYPDVRTVWVHREGRAVAVEGILTSDLLPGLSIDLNAIFAD